MKANEGKAAIFDLDGTLLDSMDLWHQIDIDFFGRRHIPLPDDYMAKVSSMRSDEVARYTIERFALPETADDLIAEWNRMAVEAYAHVDPKPNASQYLHYLKDSGARLAVATSLSPVLREPAMQHVGIADCFETVISVEETQSINKTDPEIYLLAASRLGVEPSDCTVFEDLLDAVRTAKSAGMHVWAMEDDYSLTDRSAIATIADGMIHDFADAPKAL
ncbi:HAD family phosphatase [Bifidobacterium sp. ESL0682]|uniref:HAD family hydrolase n=1 Tax=Bifidobacterium sp. ESL0682 TaxID=2983212 RepID=UPI0023F634ED|nr:HAD family phosphatase [Bifidobacterium sp. ESL0682]WEV41393.1 HAD family phosphatase [Bifidobacterium sp. ESL0682]